MKFKSIYKYILIILLIFLNAGLIYTYQPDNDFSNTKKSLTYDEHRLRIRNLFNQKTSSEAYADFKELYKDSDPNRVHDLAHLVGYLIYEKEGLKGEKICDATFTWGCYHGFIGAAYVKEGKKIFSFSENFCFNLSERNETEKEACIHGVGHGLLAIRKYTPSSLELALKDCDNFTKYIYKQSCRAGAFMEYFARSVYKQGNNQTIPPELSYDQKVNPCANLSNKDQNLCYFELAKVWEKTERESEKTYVSWCMEFSKDAREQCLNGISHGIPFNHKMQILPSVIKCKAMPDFSHIISCIKEVISTARNNSSNI